MKSWKLIAHAPKETVQAALLAHDEIEEWDYDLVISGREISEDRPQDWVLEGWFPTKPTATQKRALQSLFEGKAPTISVEELPDTDWVSESQQGTPPITAGRFFVHTPDFDPDPDLINFTIPAAQAFGTGQHETTAGCLEVLSAMKSTGMRARSIADIGTGTGLLAFAAARLWPSARVTASDIDPICADVVHTNAELNSVAIGPLPNQVTMVIADGMDDPLLRLRGPYDLLIANILAGPLVELAPDFSGSVAPGGSLLLAGLLSGDQESAVRRAYRRMGFRLVARLERGDWAILWFRRRRLT
ncbi:ribonucleotide-diphosphate reductase subunit beta [Erythrobacter longus]|uniref:Ribosomal protein L11 methyltransferase n=1 Tax=Erythrobacter longus TaxID=1044 RepID=A0A074MA16_ERYLO|nr:50S ribosomal protein L11 methyltransferase [Erythrobacter longus]KEO91631.1 ribonucleotide-diphosphate reductase subunit beta [Erythrobacter longus]